MSSLAAALLRMQGRPSSSEPVYAPVSSPELESQPTPVPVSLLESAQELEWPPIGAVDSVAPAELPAIAAPDDGAAALIRAVGRPALVAVVAVDVAGDLPQMVRYFGESLSAQTASDVVMLGPGTLDDAAHLATQWSALQTQVGYGLIHASAERAMLRLDALRQTAGVVFVVELGRTSTHIVGTLRALLASRGIPLLGTVAVRDV